MNDKINYQNWLSLNDVSIYVGVSKDTIRNWIKKNNFPAYKVGRLWKFKKQEIDFWIEQKQN